ncbi:hypothetical protein HRbin12_00591 [bacterium HR12]|nr:hypothetical protein HRbin12_00591 [bacterium HR12]
MRLATCSMKGERCSQFSGSRTNSASFGIPSRPQGVPPGSKKPTMSLLPPSSFT